MPEYELILVDPNNPPAAHELPDDHPAQQERPEPYLSHTITAENPGQATNRYHDEVYPTLAEDDPKRRYTRVELLRGPDPMAEARAERDKAVAERAELEKRLAALEGRIGASDGTTGPGPAVPGNDEEPGPDTPVDEGDSGPVDFQTDEPPPPPPPARSRRRSP